MQELIKLAELDEARPNVVSHDGDSVLLVAVDGEWRAYWNICPHQGRALDVNGKVLATPEGLLVCAAHGAGFKPHDGECVIGPCVGSSLRQLPIEVREDSIWLTAAD